MGKGKINDAGMIRMLNAGKSQADVAREFDVSPAAVSLRRKELLGKTTRVMVAKRIDKIVSHNIDTIGQLQKINLRANELLDQAEGDTPNAIKLMSEIRNQLKLQLEIFQTLYSVQAAQEFQTVVLEVIGKVSPEVRKKILAELNSRSAIRNAVTFR